MCHLFTCEREPESKCPEETSSHSPVILSPTERDYGGGSSDLTRSEVPRVRPGSTHPLVEMRGPVVSQNRLIHPVLTRVSFLGMLTPFYRGLWVRGRGSRPDLWSRFFSTPHRTRRDSLSQVSRITDPPRLFPRPRPSGPPFPTILLFIFPLFEIPAPRTR